MQAADVQGHDAPPNEAPSALAAPKVKASSRFHSAVGIQEIACVKRNCKCYFCEDTLTKGSTKFVYAFNKSRPARSIHPGCVFSMDASAAKNSIQLLEELLAGDSLTAATRAVCVKALSVLQPVVQAAAT